MVAGALGPADAASSSDSGLGNEDVAPVTHTLALRTSQSEPSSEDDGSELSHVPDAADLPEEVRDASGSPPGRDVVTTDRYRDVFGDLQLHDAMLEMFCQAAQLGGDLFGDNVADTAVMTEEQIELMEARATALGVHSLQTLYGHINTSKVHRLVRHLGDELRGPGNLWEVDTSENEKLHSSFKRMSHRSNKRGPTVALQMMRCDEAQSSVLRELREADVAATAQESPDPSRGGGNDGTSAEPPTLTEQLSFTGRGRREYIGNVRLSPGLGQVGVLLGLGDGDSVTVHRTARIMARFEWGATTVVQRVRAASSFMGKPWFSSVRYEAPDGGTKWGRARLVLRSIGGTRRSCIVVQRLRRVEARPGCVLSRFGCVRLAWDFEADTDVHPALELVDATRVLRVEDLQVDWFDLSDRLGLFATPANQSPTAEERHAARFFTNVFYPWTSRSLRPGF